MTEHIVWLLLFMITGLMTFMARRKEIERQRREGFHSVSHETARRAHRIVRAYLKTLAQDGPRRMHQLPAAPYTLAAALKVLMHSFARQGNRLHIETLKQAYLGLADFRILDTAAERRRLERDIEAFITQLPLGP